MVAVYMNLQEQKGKAAEGGTRRTRIQLEPSRTIGLFLAITQHPFYKTHALFVQQLSDSESCEKIGRRLCEDRKAILVGAPDADIFREAIIGL